MAVHGEDRGSVPAEPGRESAVEGEEAWTHRHAGGDAAEGRRAGAARQVGQRLIAADEDLRSLVGEHGAAAEVRGRLERRLAELLDQIDSARRQQGATHAPPPVAACW